MYIYIYIYIYVCVCVCVYTYIRDVFLCFRTQVPKALRLIGVDVTARAEARLIREVHQ